MTDIEKLVLELSFISEEIAALYNRKKELEKEMKAFSDSIREICAGTGKTIDDIEVK